MVWVLQNETVLDRLSRWVETLSFYCRSMVANILRRQAVSLMLTGTNTFSSLLAGAGANIPAFQSLFNYVLMAIVWSGVCWYKYGFKGWANMIYKRGWKCKSKYSI
jgi:solute carrier family 35 protein F1/2